MFKFNRVLNATSGTWYYISSARLATDEYDRSENGANAFAIDLIPLAEGGAPIFGLTLSVSNGGTYAMLTKDLDKQRSTYKEYAEELQQDVVREEMQYCIIDGNTLIVTQDVCLAALDKLLRKPPQSVGEATGIIRAFQTVMELEGQRPHAIAVMAEKVCKAAGIQLPENFVRED